MPSATRSPTTSATETATTATNDSPPPNNDSGSPPDDVSSPTKTQGPLGDHGHARSLRPLLALLRLVGDLLTLRQRLVTLALNPAEVDKQILTAVIGRDESVPLLAVEPLDSSSCHLSSPPLPAS